MSRQHAQTPFHHPHLHQIFDSLASLPSWPGDLNPERLHALLKQFQAKFSSQFLLAQIGESVEHRPIYEVTLGTGPLRLLLWSQMHGNEPTATNALVAIFEYFLSAEKDAFVRTILENCTLTCIPMLNPDGAEANTRRNAQGLDINRDARDLQTPEGRLLKSVRDRLQPHFGFNLHDQNGRRTVGDTNKIVAIALLVPPFDRAESDSPGRIEAKRVASVMRSALQPYINGHIARYDADYMPRAFGDSMQAWGTKTVLLEAGGWYAPDPQFLVRMNFIAILEACHAIASTSYLDADPNLYESLARNDKELFDLLIKDALLFDGVGQSPYRSDIGINFLETISDGSPSLRGEITDLGDMAQFTAKEQIDGSDLLVLPGLIGCQNDSEADTEAALIQRGYTTVVHKHDLLAEESVAAHLERLRHDGCTLNTGLAIDLAQLASVPHSEQATVLGDALAAGALAVLCDDDASRARRHPLTERIIDWLLQPRLDRESMSTRGSWPGHLRLAETACSGKRAADLRLSGRGRIRIGDAADLAVYRRNDRAWQNLTDDDLLCIYVNGHRIDVQNAAKESDNKGSILKRG